MPALTINLPESIQPQLTEQLSAAGFTDPTEYVLALINRDSETQRKHRLEHLLLEGLDSAAIEMTKADWEQMRREYDTGQTA
jgi:hypothetical protein